jgi:translation initiation factor 4E
MSEDPSATAPLHRKWVLWYDNPRLAPEGTDWKDNLKNCGSFSTIQEFWTLFNHVKPASHLSVNSNYHLFKEGVIPMWEDPENKHGGKFVLTIPKKDSKEGRCDEWWLYTVLAIVGETIDLNGNQVCGAVVSIRKSQDRIALWLRTSDKEKCIEVGERWKKALQLNKTHLKFQLHDDGKNFRNDLTVVWPF